MRKGFLRRSTYKALDEAHMHGKNDGSWDLGIQVQLRRLSLREWDFIFF